ncbi:MAG: O-antigen ligase family protein [Bacteroidales bacterium]|jgi:O-antigen ligase/Flp pilus assembly protein TadD|nr:O-antigen ligase family protein [Bacteroidales bacterium]
MWKQGLNINKITAALLSLVLLTGLWNLSVFYIPVLLITGIAGFIVIRNFPVTIPVSIVALSFFLLLIYETVNLQLSAYQANSILFLRDFMIIFCCILFIDKLLKNRKYRTFFVVFISLIAGLLALLNIPLFFFKYYESTICGFNDFSQFRFLYRPMGFLSNEWITILLCFLPFPIIGLLLFWKKTPIRYGFLFIIGLLAFNILVSFSRAGILAFLLFIGLLNLFFCSNCLFSIRKLLLSNAVLILLFALFAVCFSGSIQSSIRQTNTHQRSTEGRLKQWEEVTNTIGRTPFFGIGSKNYALLGRESTRVDLEYSFTGRVNNTYIQLLIEKGWTGLLLWLCVIGIFVFHSFQRIRKGKNRLDKAIDSIVLSAILAVLFREIFFSSLLYNSGLLLFFFILLISNQKEIGKTIAIRKPVFLALVVFFSFSSIYFYIKEPDSALYYATKGLEQERSTPIPISYNSLNEYPDSLTKTKRDTLEQAIQYYKKACLLSLSDALFQHNLGWLYWINQQPDSALYYLSKAVESEPNVALYYISKGLITESKNPDEAFENYKLAILLSPDIIDSPFFKDLKERNPVKTEELLLDASNELLQILSVCYTSVIEAKSGKILLSLSETERAYETFNHVTQIHPNLNRPWYYLGFIEQTKGNFDAMQVFYKKSLFLSPFDHLPLYAFASYYKKAGEEQKANSYYKSAGKAWKNKRSIHSSQCKRIYYSDTEKDDVIPQGLLDYITPEFQTQTYDTN